MNPLIKINLLSFNAFDWPQFLQDFVAANQDLFTITSEMSNAENYLIYKDKKLEFHSAEFGKMSFDFESDLHYHGRQNYSISKEPLAKALGLVGHPGKLIWDCTCGTGKDALLISHFKGNVKAFERHPLIYLLLLDAKMRANLNIEIIKTDTSGIPDVESLEKPEVIYYDPMYPEKKKSALPRKEMLIFKTIVGVDADSKEFLDWALKTAKERVVVKRPLHAEPIKENPSAVYLGKSTRYDMYKIFG